MASKPHSTILPDFDLSLLNVHPDDTASIKLLMLIEGVYGQGVKHSITKYGYTEQRYYQLLKQFQTSGSASLVDKKRGPKDKSVRTGNIVQQIIRYKFLDPELSAPVISQKLRQTGMIVSTRSVERTIREYGLQKKTLPVKSG
jgi:hypothetical protein